MKIIISKKISKILCVIVAIVLLIGVSVATMKYYQQDEQSKINRSNALQVSKSVQNELVPATAPDFFTEYRLEREKIRSERSDLLRDIIKTAKNEDVRQRAQDNVLKMVLDKQQESEIESMIKARGFSDSLVFIRDNSVSAVIKATTLSKEQVMQVADIINRISGISAENITISAKP